MEQKARAEEQQQALKERAKEEELLSLEFQSMQQVQEIQAKRKTDDDMEALQAEYEAMQKQAQLQHERAMRDMKKTKGGSDDKGKDRRIAKESG